MAKKGFYLNKQENENQVNHMEWLQVKNKYFLDILTGKKNQ